MSEEENNIQQVLSEINLNEYQSRAYLAILEGGVIIAREISDRSSIPYAKVYQVLDSLIQKALIVGDEGRPKKFRAISPEDAIPTYLEQMKQEYLESHEKKIKLVNEIMSSLIAMHRKKTISFENQQGVWNITGRSNILSRVAKLFENVTSEVLITTNKEHFKALRLRKKLNTFDEDISIKIRSKDPLENLPGHTELKVNRDISPATKIIFDDFAVLSVVAREQGKYNAGEYAGIITQITEFVESEKINFELLFKEG